MHRIILINGKARVGKDTLASFLVKELNSRGFNNVYVRGNAQTVKDYAKKYFNWDGKKTDEGRKLLINITNMMYDLDPTFWECKTNEFFMGKIEEHKKEDVILIIPDWRYRNTLDYFRRVANCYKYISVHTIHLERKGFKNNLSQELKADISESDILKNLCDIHITKGTSKIEGFVDIAKMTIDRITRESE